jgi:hypothetical protein
MYELFSSHASVDDIPIITLTQEMISSIDKGARTSDSLLFRGFPVKPRDESFHRVQIRDKDLDSRCKVSPI